MKVADQVAAYLADQGLKRVFGIPGTENLPLIEGLGSRGVDYVLVSHESAGAFMADAAAYLTNGLQVCVVTRGPGAANLLPGLASAHFDGSPVLAITGEVERKRRERFAHQAFDLDTMYAPVTKGSFYVTAENAAETLHRAVSLALSERPGAVRLGLSGAEGSRDAVGRPLPPDVVSAPPPDDAALESLGARLKGADRPFLLVGAGVWRARQAEAFLALAERLGAPVAATARAKGVFPESHLAYCGVLSLYQDAPIRAVMDESDLILAVGVDGGEFFVDWRHRAPVVSLSAGDADPYFQPSLHVKGELGSSLSRLASLPAGSGWGEAAARRCRAEIERLFEEGEPCEGALSPQGAARALRDILPPDAIVTTDVGSHKLVVGQIWRASGPGHFITSSVVSSMGGGIPAATAASLEVPGSPVVAVVGDGGILMSAGELGTLARLGANVLVVVFNDSTLSSIRRKQEVARYRPAGVITGKADFAAMAESFGIPGFRATTESDMARAVDHWRGSGGPCLLDVAVEYAYYRPMGY